MSTIALVRANAILPCVAFLERIGAPAERLLCEAGLSPGVTGDGERLLPLHACLTFLERAAQLENLPGLGLIIGRQTPFEQLGAYARLIRHSPTLGHALRVLVGAISLHSSCDVLWLSHRGARVLFCHRFAGLGSVGTSSESTPPGWIQGELLTLSFMIAAIRAAIGPTWAPDEVWLPAAAAAWHKDWEGTLNIPVQCGGDLTAIVFPATLLGAPNRACQTPREEPDELVHLRETSPATDLAGAVRQVIGTLLVDGYPEIARTAHALGFSVRTLQRRLAESGGSYSQLVNQARFDACVQLMGAGDVRLADIACDVGYADQANFSRAFRRWTGKPPRVFRRDSA